MADAVQVLTEAARLRTAPLDQGHDGTWSPSESRTEQADWAEFITLAIAGATANIGSTEAALAGRPGSWEAAAVRALLASVVGADDEHLMEHRREPIRVNVCVEELLEGTEMVRRYDEAFDTLDAQDWADALAYGRHFRQLVWEYRREESDRWVALDPQAPPFWMEGWRTDQRLQGQTAQQIDQSERWLSEPIAGQVGRTTYVCRSAFARRQLIRLEREEVERADPADELEQHQLAEFAAYGESFKAEILKEAARRYAGIPIEVTIDINTTASTDISDDPCSTPEAYLVAHARLTTPLPGSAIAPKDSLRPGDQRR